jgi:hypothetical protein
MTVIRLMGRLGVEHLKELRAQIAERSPVPVLDLGEVDLVDVEGIRFLIAVQREGIEVRNAAPYIREWMNRVRGDKS